MDRSNPLDDYNYHQYLNWWQRYYFYTIIGREKNPTYEVLAASSWDCIENNWSNFYYITSNVNCFTTDIPSNVVQAYQAKH